MEVLKENPQGRSSNVFYGRLQAFFLGAKCNDAVLGVARLLADFGLGR